MTDEEIFQYLEAFLGENIVLWHSGQIVGVHYLKCMVLRWSLLQLKHENPWGPRSGWAQLDVASLRNLRASNDFNILYINDFRRIAEERLGLPHTPPLAYAAVDECT